jgi:hypothetical protein
MSFKNKESQLLLLIKQLIIAQKLMAGKSVKNLRLLSLIRGI